MAGFNIRSDVFNDYVMLEFLSRIHRQSIIGLLYIWYIWSPFFCYTSFSIYYFLYRCRDYVKVVPTNLKFVQRAIIYRKFRIVLEQHKGNNSI